MKNAFQLDLYLVLKRSTRGTGCVSSQVTGTDADQRPIGYPFMGAICPKYKQNKFTGIFFTPIHCMMITIYKHDGIHLLKCQATCALSTMNWSGRKKGVNSTTVHPWVTDRICGWLSPTVYTLLSDVTQMLRSQRKCITIDIE